MSHSLGTQLRQARTKRGLSLLDVAHKTRIPAQHLHDLEADNYNTHGGLTYAKSFLRHYANFLDVDASAILDRLQPPPLGGAQDYRYLVSSLGPWIRSRQFRASRPRPKGASQRGSLVSMSMIVGGIVLLGSGLMFANAMFSFGPKTPAPAPEAADAKRHVVRVLPAISAGETSQVSWTASSATPVASPAPAVSEVPTPIPVAVPVDGQSGELLKPSQVLPPPVKAIPVED